MLTGLKMAFYLFVITIHCHFLLIGHMVQMAPVLDNGLNSETNLSRHIFDNSLHQERSHRTTLPIDLIAQSIVNQTESTSLNATTSSNSSTSRFHHQSRRSQVRLMQIIPVDLLNPCKMEDENWSESYFNDYPSESKDEKYEHDSEQDEWEHHLSESVLNDHLTKHTEDPDRARVTLTKLAGKAKFGYDLLREMILKANNLQGLVTDMIRNHLIKECRHLELPEIMEIPKQHNFTDTNLVTTLSGIYQTLANQTAHHYFIWTQQRKQSNRVNVCGQHGQPIQVEVLLQQTSTSNSSTVKPLAAYFNKRAHARRVADDFLVVSSNLRGLMCDFKKAFHLFDIPVPTRSIVQQVLNHTFTGSMACSRMSVVDCQLMKNSVKIFSDIEEFLRNQSNIIQFFGNHHTGKMPRTT